MFRLFTIAVLILPCSMLQAEEHSWSLNSENASGLSVHGEIDAAAGVDGNSAVLDGESLLKVKDSERLTIGEAGFTLTAWANPYRLSGEQQMIAAKNRYSLGQRQWGVMIDKDNRFRLFVWQDKWATVGCDMLPKPGHWHLIGVVVRPASAELWVNGKLAGQVKLTKPIPQTKAPLTFGGVDDNGRIWQNFAGALDEIRLVDKPLDAKQMAAAYKPVTATHEIPKPPQPFALWSGPPMPQDPADLPVPDRLTHSVIHRPGPDDYKFLHGAG